ncbi:sugar ABC transporter ATP-binding protein [Couchioplanes azureus]|uniref:sugar ABC transporter ATP-binding protein n=1 Tax=Couchioplanes caeruleus TaxID=56438 RepID=UPI0019879C10|nr:sugar ABC transporter ATP-binding protein [Couchioplanes caeruleus]GGQ69246.1 hypothetical protein GCM10010166_43790 [Couchioplanes caeruleus subsp. azureus]
MALLEVVDVCKEFPGVRALDGVSFTLQPGEVHALVGENGAGKSTLIKVLTGVHHPDRGRLRYRAEPVRFDSPMDAQRAGISAIHQEVNLIPLMSVAHNLFLGREPRTTLGLLDEKRMVREAREVLSRYGVATDVRRQLGTLALGAQQMVALARAVMIDARVVIMDEPTSSLEPREVETLFGVIGDLHAKGIGVVYVSHRLDELYRICDTVTILRDGKVVHTGRLADLERIRLVALMLGRETATVRRQGFTTFATHHSSSRSGTPSPIPGNRQATPSPAGADAGRTRADANPAPRHTGATDDEPQAHPSRPRATDDHAHAHPSHTRATDDHAHAHPSHTRATDDHAHAHPGHTRATDDHAHAHPGHTRVTGSDARADTSQRPTDTDHPQADASRSQVGEGDSHAGDPVLRVTGLSSRQRLHDIGFTVRRGEVVGLGGLLGAGRSETIKAIAGAYPIDSGVIEVDGKDLRHPTTVRAVRAGIAVLPEDRKAEGIVPGLSVRENIALAVLPQLSRWGLVSDRKIDKIVDRYMTRLRIKASSPHQGVGDLSGGNQQKVLLARLLATNPRILLLDEPTRGIDIGAKAEVQGLIDDLAAEGLGVVLVSSDAEELVEGSHRVVVLRDGTIIGELQGENVTTEALLETIATAAHEAATGPAVTEPVAATGPTAAKPAAATGPTAAKPAAATGPTAAKPAAATGPTAAKPAAATGPVSAGEAAGPSPATGPTAPEPPPTTGATTPQPPRPIGPTTPQPPPTTRATTSQPPPTTGAGSGAGPAAAGRVRDREVGDDD